jgi:hypothetical protein
MKILNQVISIKLITILTIILAFGITKTYAQADTACAGSSTNIYDVPPNAGSTYTWSLKNSLGTIVPIAGRTDSILITYGTVPGIDTLRLIETGPSGCLGDTMKLAVIILPNVTATISGTDSICVNNASVGRLRVVLTGSTSWNITYTDGTTPISVTGITASPYIFNSPTYSTQGVRTFTLTSVSGIGSCPAAISGSGSVRVFPKPGAVTISHY